ncbi:hypothetical protein [Butyricicoccus pullicaecorum]|uniref:hypothetical protein n=1 Tax=Butyricicoccus pullicaecorum TaxID=501571 RepID=UPI0013A6040C|nr:hypothetical protein [Butyricicoccus pullicaecorum]
MKFSLEPFSKGSRSLEAEPQVARRNGRNSFLIPGVRPGNQSKQTKKERPTGWLVFPEISRPAGRDYFFILVDFPSRGIGKIKREFRALRSAASLRGWIAPGLRPGPVCRLRAGFSFLSHKKRPRNFFLGLSIFSYSFIGVSLQ